MSGGHGSTFPAGSYLTIEICNHESLCCTKTVTDPLPASKLVITFPAGDPCRRFRFDWPKFLAGDARLQFSLRGVQGVDFQAKVLVLWFDMTEMWVHCDFDRDVAGGGESVNFVQYCMLRSYF